MGAADDEDDDENDLVFYKCLVVHITCSSDARIAVESRETVLTLRSSSMVHTLANPGVSVTVGHVVIMTETANTRVNRAAKHRRSRVPGCTLLTELTLYTHGKYSIAIIIYKFLFFKL